MKVFKAIILAAASLAALSSNSMAIEKTLPPGRPAGVSEAARGGGHLLVTLGVATVLIGAVAIAISSSNSANPPATTGTAP